MGSFTAGLVTGCLLGVSGTFLLLFVGVAFSGHNAPVLRVRSLLRTLVSAIILFCIAAICHLLNIGKDASMLLLLLAVLAVSKLEGLVIGLIASAIAVLILVMAFLPPVGSLMVRNSSDRLALALFILIAGLGSRMIGGRETPAS